MKQEDFDRIERYIKGEAGESDRKYIETMMADEEHNLYLRKCINKDFEENLETDTSSDIDISHILHRIHHIIRKKEISKKQKPMQKFLRLYMKAAAVLLIPLLVSGGFIYFYLSGKNNSGIDLAATSEIFAPLGSRVSFNLPDGTTGMLNSGSHLSYSLPFADNRRINLEGEAWLEVKSDETHPFEISAGNSTVEVLGTRFNLSAYPVENYIEVVLDEGKVEFQGNNDEEKVTIHPEERLIYHNGQTSKTVVDPDKYRAWTEGKLVFRGDPMAEVARRIERWYNVRVTIADKELEKYSFRATFQDDSLEDVLKLLAMTSPIGFKISPRILLPDGTYKKEEAIIYKK